ncbi:FAS1-like dehydratase domain-containing protein [Muricoccus radiodurans]|uniref:FAS1-like dehydratase domain-containing protein n=1 Tax=Muricoccus radiodurans TaxID=2231721 RepID=UPI003CF2CD38
MSDDLSSWIGRSREVRDELTAPAMRRLAATLDREPPDLSAGAPVPPHWIAVLFDDAAPQSRLGPDGHPLKGDFLPPVPLPRRMLAGRRLTFHEPPRVGDALLRRSEIVAITPKEGRSGKLVFVTVRHITSGPRGVVAVEDHDTSYREAAGGAAPAAKGAEPGPEVAWTVPFRPDPVLLFRYSALGFNGHRIHYDADYARTEEGYRALVVNGGLTTLMLLEAALAQGGGALRGYSARTMTPLFVGDEAALHGTARDAAGKATIWATAPSGATALRIEAEFGA